VGGNRESVQDGHNGRVVPPERPDLLAAALLPLLADPAQSATMGQHAQQVAHRFRTEDMVAQVAERYAALCRSQG